MKRNIIWWNLKINYRCEIEAYNLFLSLQKMSVKPDHHQQLNSILEILLFQKIYIWIVQGRSSEMIFKTYATKWMDKIPVIFKLFNVIDSRTVNDKTFIRFSLKEQIKIRLIYHS